MIMKNVKKILLSFIISILMFNFICSNVVNATSNTNASTNASDTAEVKSEQEFSLNFNFTSSLDGLVGIFTIFERVKIVILGGVFQYLGTLVGESAGTTYNANALTIITPEDILFNKLAITDINFFNISSFGTGSNQKSLSSNNPIKLLKQNIANWYMTLRTTALIILSAILIYIGIRMVISTSAENKSNYKKMFMNWVVSLAMVFLLHYLIILVINVNNALVEIIYSSTGSMNASNSSWFGNYMTRLIAGSFYLPSAVYSWSSAIVYLCIVALTFVFLIMYIKRMIVIAFLILISPLITITYSIDKVGDGQAQAFSNWLKEFMQNVLIQPFHCLIYVAFVSITMNLLKTTNSLASAVLTILTMFFILQSESIIKKIFNITADTTGNSAATAAILGTAYSKLSVGGNRARVATNGAKNATVASKLKPQASSNVAQKNIEASNETGSVTNAKKPTNFSQELSSRINSPQALTADYNRTMDKDVQTEKLIDAQGADYDYLMGNSTERSNNVNTASALAGSKIESNAVNVGNGSNNVENENSREGNTKTNTENINEKDWKYYAKKGLKYTGKGIKMVDKYSPDLAGMALSGTLAGVAGKNLAETGAAMAVGRKMQKNTEAYIGDLYEEKKEYMSKKLLEIKQDRNKAKLESDFQNYKNGAKVNRNADIQSARNYLAMKKDKIPEIKSEPERQYVQSLHAMRDLYIKDGLDEDPTERVIQSMENIIDKDEKKNVNKIKENPKE